MKIETMSVAQWGEIPKIRQRWLDNASRQVSTEEAEDAVSELYKLQGLEKPKIIHVASPLAGFALVSSLKKSTHGASLRDSLWDSLSDSLRASLWASLRASLSDSLGASLRASLWAFLGDSLWASLGDSLWASPSDSLSLYYWQYDMAFFEGGQVAKANYDAVKYECYKRITSNLSVIFPYRDLCIVCANPIYCGWDDNGRIHGEGRAAVEYADGFKIWAIEGIRVPEPVVIAPESQTIEEINAEGNEEVKRIRINRFGWHRYLEQSNAEVLDIATPNNGAWMESLMRLVSGDNVYHLLCTYDPSTKRPYALEVSQDCKTCEQAQRYLLAPEIAFARLGVSPEQVKTYPLMRT